MAAYRSGDTPMDFEWANKTGQVPQDSPFHRQGLDRRLNSFASEPQKSPQRPNAIFGTSNVKLPQTPSMPHAYREIDMDFSTDNCSSPEAADTEDTPDIPRIANAIHESNITVGRGHSELRRKPSKRDSFMSRMPVMVNMFQFTPPKLDHHALQRRSRKRSRKEYNRGQMVHQSTYDPDFNDDSRPSSREGSSAPTAVPPVKEMGYFPAFFAFLAKYPDLPHILSHYATFALSWGLVILLFWCLYAGVSALRNDVRLAVEERMSEILRENAECMSLYQQNRCGPDSQTPPYMQKQCAQWLDCGSRDPKDIGSAVVSASTFAIVLNNFVEPLSWKLITAMVFVVATLVSIPKMFFGFLSKKYEAPAQVHYPPPPHFPPTPYMQSPYHPQAFDPQQQFYTPRHQRIGDAYEQDMSPSRRAIRGRSASPTKRLEH